MLVHKTPTHEITTPVLPVDYKHPKELTCRNCGGSFNTSFALTAHAESKHYTQVVFGGRDQ